MSYPECVRCANQYRELEPIILKIDKILETLPLGSILSPETFSQNLSERTSRIEGIFNLLYDEKLLIKNKYYECPNPHCDFLIEISQYNKAKEDGESFQCPACEINLTDRALKSVDVFRFNPERYIPVKKVVPISPDFFGADIISILFISADPSDTPRIRTNQEFREIHDQLSLSQLREKFELEQPLLSVRPQDVSQALLRMSPHIVHFSGHGTPDGALCFEDPSGKLLRVESGALADLFRQFTPKLTCVILNACFSEEQAKEISQNVRYVIGVKDSIGDEIAIAYSIGFYQALGAGRRIEEAHELGCTQIRLTVSKDLLPVLFKR